MMNKLNVMIIIFENMIILSSKNIDDNIIVLM
jgi:hypothetical protein